MFKLVIGYCRLQTKLISISLNVISYTWSLQAFLLHRDQSAMEPTPTPTTKPAPMPTTDVVTVDGKKYAWIRIGKKSDLVPLPDDTPAISVHAPAQPAPQIASENPSVSVQISAQAPIKCHMDSAWSVTLSSQ